MWKYVWVCGDVVFCMCVAVSMYVGGCVCVLIVYVCVFYKGGGLMYSMLIFVGSTFMN